MQILVPAALAELTADGGSDGYVEVADNTIFYAGAEAWLYYDAGGGDFVNQRLIITDLKDATKIGVRFLPDDLGTYVPQYGRSDASEFLTGSFLSMPAQAVPDPSP